MKKFKNEVILNTPPHNFPKSGFEPGGLQCMPCCFCASQGFTMGNIDGMLKITHGPPGCSYHIWGFGREGQFTKMTYTTNLNENDIIFGGEKKLISAIKEAVELFHPEVIGIFNTCVSGLIGDKVESICQQAEKTYNIRVIPFLCEGFKNITGFDYTSGVMAEKIYGIDNIKSENFKNNYPINFAASTYGGENKSEYDYIFNQLGFNIVSTVFSNSSFNSLTKGHQAVFTAAEGGRSLMNYADIIHKRFNMNVIPVNFSSIPNTADSLMKMAEYIGNPELIQKTSALIKTETNKVLHELNLMNGEWDDVKVVIYGNGPDNMAYKSILTYIGVNSEIITDGNFTESMFIIQYPDGKQYSSLFFQGIHGLFYSCFYGTLRFAKYFHMEVKMGRRLVKELED